MSGLRQGRIVYAPFADPQGRNPKTRPGVVVTTDADIAAGLPIRVVAVTGACGVAPRQVVVELPWDRAGHPRTKLYKPSEAVCDWSATFTADQLTDTSGYVPAKWLARVLQIVADLDAATLPPPPDPPPAG